MNVPLLSQDSDLYIKPPPTSHIFLKSKLEIVTAVGPFSFIAQSNKTFEITPSDIVQGTGVCRAHQSRHRFLFLGGKRSCFKKNCEHERFPISNEGEGCFFMDLQETHKDHQRLTWKCLIKPSLHLIGGVLSPIISKRMCGSTALRS